MGLRTFETLPDGCLVSGLYALPRVVLGIAIPIRNRRACACSISSAGTVEGVATPLPRRYARRSIWVLKQSPDAEPGTVSGLLLTLPVKPICKGGLIVSQLFAYDIYSRTMRLDYPELLLK